MAVRNLWLSIKFDRISSMSWSTNYIFPLLIFYNIWLCFVVCDIIRVFFLHGSKKILLANFFSRASLFLRTPQSPLISNFTASEGQACIIWNFNLTICVEKRQDYLPPLATKYWLGWHCIISNYLTMVYYRISSYFSFIYWFWCFEEVYYFCAIKNHIQAQINHPFPWTVCTHLRREISFCELYSWAKKREVWQKRDKEFPKSKRGVSHLTKAKPIAFTWCTRTISQGEKRKIHSPPLKLWPCLPCYSKQQQQKMEGAPRYMHVWQNTTPRNPTVNFSKVSVQKWDGLNLWPEKGELCASLKLHWVASFVCQSHSGKLKF